ncbi:MAG TPA: GNVR domain-containing protein [Candidatus Limnocylindrales bacterium]|nr:GNVR domain-containing protein [Candidatus Limnocylindrales bacterium]
MELSGYLAVAKRWWWTLIVSAWIAGLAGYIVASGLPPTYESQVKVLVGPINTDTDTLRASGLLVQTYAQVVLTDSVLSSTVQELGLNITPDDFRSATRATANDVTRILTIRVQSGDPKQAADLANTLATELEQLTSKGLSQPAGLIQIVEFAQPSTEPVAPQVSLIAILAALAGVVAAVMIVLLLEYFASTIRNGEELATLAGAPALSSVGVASGSRPQLSDVVVDAAPDSRAASAYRLAAAKIAFAGEGRWRRSFVVTDVDWEGQAAVVAANLAAALGRLGRPVVLIDGAGHEGSVSSIYGLVDAPGLTEILAGAMEPEVDGFGGQRVRVLPSGRLPLDVVDPNRVRELLDSILATDVTVVVSVPPIKDAPQALTFARAAEGVVVVARRDRAHRDDVQFASESIRLVGATVLGVIIAEKAGLFERPRATDRSGTHPVAQPLGLTTASPARDGRSIDRRGAPSGGGSSRRTRRVTLDPAPDAAAGRLPTS